MALAPPVSWFHGGIPGLEPGDLILPPRETGVLTIGEVLKRHAPAVWLAAGYAKDDPSRVSLTRDLAEAKYHAVLWSVTPWREGAGHVYRVEPAERPVRVPGWLESTCSQATVTEVVTRDAGHTLPGGSSWLLAGELFKAWRSGCYPLPAPGRVIVRQ
jgi:hypothetical protein